MAQEFETVREVGLAIKDIRKDMKLYAGAFGFIALLGVGAIGFLADRAFDAQRALGVIEGQLQGIDNKLTQVDSRLVGLEDRMSRIEAIVERIDVNTRQASLELDSSPATANFEGWKRLKVYPGSDIEGALSAMRTGEGTPMWIYVPEPDSSE